MDLQCPGVVEVRRTHGKRQALVRESMKNDAQLRERFEGAETADLLAHLAACERCHAFDETHRCPVCELALLPEVGGEVCTSGWHKFKRTIGWVPKKKTEPDAPPAKADVKTAKRKPAPAPTPAPTARAAAPAQPAYSPPKIPKPPKARKPAKPMKAATPPPPPTRVARPPPPPPPPPPAPPRTPARSAQEPQEKPREAHEILGVAPDATIDEVRRAFRDKAKNYHPDRVNHLAPEFKALAEKHMLELNTAYDTMRKRAKALEKTGSA